MKGYNKISRCIHPSSVPIYWAVTIVMMLLNGVYMLGVILGHTWYHYPQQLLHNCTILPHPHCHSSSIYRHELFALVAKVTVVCITFTAELVLAIRVIHRTEEPGLPLPICLAQLMNKQCRCLQTILLWQAFLFAQLLLGLLPIPLIVLSIVSPLTSVCIVSSIALIFVLTAAAIALILRNCRIKCTCTSWKHLGSWCVLYTVVIVLAIAVAKLCYYFITGGVSVSRAKAIALSLVPSILLSGIAWVIKRRFLNKKTFYLERRPSFRSISTEQEELGLDDMQEELGLDDMQQDVALDMFVADNDEGI